MIELKPTKVPTITSESEVKTLDIEGIEFPVRTDFLERDKALSDWGGSATIWRDLEAEVEGKLITSTNLVYDAIYNSFTTNETYGINEDSYVNIGDCKLKVEMKDGIVTYYIKGNN